MFGFFSPPKRVVDGRATREVVATAEVHSLEAGKTCVIISPSAAGTAACAAGGTAHYKIESRPAPDAPDS